MKKALRTVSFLLCLLLLLSAFVSCKKNKDEQNGDADGSTVSTQGGEVTDKYVKDDLPDDLDFEGAEINVFSWKERVTEDWIEQATPGAIIEEATYERQKSVEHRMNVVFNIITEPGEWGFRERFLRTLEGEIDAETSGIDLVAQYMPVAPLGAINGLYGDLGTSKYLNFEKPWWPGNITDACSIAGTTYFCTGDVTPTTVTMMGNVFINLELYESYGGNRAEIYRLVKEKQWTMEALKKMSLDVVGEVVGGEADRYGILIDHGGIYDNLFAGGGFNWIEKDEDGYLILSEDVDDERLVNWFEICNKLLYENPDVVMGKDIIDNYVSGSSFRDVFATGKALVYMNGVIADIQTDLRALSIEFAVTPYPMYDENQEQYQTITGFHTTMYSIPHNVRDFEMCAIALEALGSEGYRSLTPTIYEDSFRYRFFDSEENAEMLDIIRESLVWDPGRTFGESLGVFNQFRPAAQEGFVWSDVSSKRGTWEGNIDNINGIFG